MHGLEAEYWDRVDFVYIDREDGDNRDVVERFNISAQPIFILLDASGNELQRWFGPVNAGVLRQALDGVLAG